MNKTAAHFQNLFQQSAWSTDITLSSAARAAYETGLDLVNGYTGETSVLTNAFKSFMATGSRPYALAGAAFILYAAAFQPSRDGYDSEALGLALGWLEQAQAQQPDAVEINVVEAFLYLADRKLSDARLVLDHLHSRELSNFYVCQAETWYWDVKGNFKEVERWAAEGLKSAHNRARQGRMLVNLAQGYMRHDQYAQAAEAYRRLVLVEPDNFWAWQNLSVMYFNLKQYKEAADSNRRALKLNDWPAARAMEKEIGKKLGFWDKLLGG